MLGAAYSFQNFSRMIDGGTVLDNPDGRATDQAAARLSLEYSATERLTLGVQLPYVQVRSRIPAEGQTLDVQGLGDLRLLAKSSLGPKGGHGWLPQVLPVISLGLPTGRFEPSLGARNIGTGIGLASLGLGVSGVWALVAGIGEAWVSAFAEQPIGRNSEGYEFGTTANVQGGGFFGVYRGSGAGVTASFESYAADRFDGAEIALRKGQFSYLGPMLQFSLNRGWSLNADMQWLVGSWTGGTQKVAPWRASVSAALSL